MNILSFVEMYLLQNIRKVFVFYKDILKGVMKSKAIYLTYLMIKNVMVLPITRFQPACQQRPLIEFF